MKVFDKIYKVTYKAIAIMMGIALCCITTVSCVDDDINIDDQDRDGGIELEGDVLAFTMELDKSLSTRSGSDITGSIIKREDIEGKDDWIDMQDKFRIFFFSEAGDFLFGVTDRIIGSLENRPNSTAKDYWYIRIPMTMIVDRDNKEYDMAKIKKYLKEHKFKIAVLANWPNGGEKINPGDYDDSSENNFKDNPSSSLKGEPLWGWSNSILNASASDIKNINDLHFLFEDTYYGNTESTGRPSRSEVYSAFYNSATNSDGAAVLKVGEPTDWVKMRSISDGWNKNYKNAPVGSFDSKETANQWIRYNWDPSIEINNAKGIYRHYQHLWYLWNFNAIYNVGISKATNKEATARSYYAANFDWNDGKNISADEETPNTTVNRWGYEWWQRNGEELYNKWINKSNTNEVTSTNPKNLDNYTLSSVGDGSNSAFLEFVATTSTDPYRCQFVKIGDNYGVKLPEMQNKGTNTEKGNSIARVDGTSRGYFKFLARTSGTLRIKWGSADNNAAQIVVQKGGVRDKTYDVAAGNYGEWFDINGTKTNDDTYRDFSVGEDSQDIYIWCSSGNAVIYGIEYIRGKYLYDTDREGIYPNEDQGIPMYGVQQYDPIPDWEYGTTYDLNSQANVSLIRALAKVIVHIPEAFGNPTHMYMRCMNRTAFCEPMDVETNTSEIWNEKHHNDEGDKRYCEWFNIQSYGPAFNKKGSKPDDKVREEEVKDKTELNDYINWLGWFHGSWQKMKWKASSRSYNETDGFWSPADTGWSFTGSLDNYSEGATGLKGVYSEETEKTQQKTYPRLFNPHINRSDFCHFIYTGKYEGYHRWVLYVPDKNIDDPNYPGIFFCTPKVPHIEYRFKAPETSAAATPVDAVYSNTEFNLDDNDCHRIYFTNYGYDSDFKQTEKNENIRNQDLGAFDDYEKNKTNLAKHWPIMRNHIYEFFVSGSGPETPFINVKVTDWSHEKVVIDW